MFGRRQFISGIGTAGIAVCAGCLGGSEPSYWGESASETKWWSQPQFDAISSCYNPASVGPRTGVRERWQLDISGPSARPVVANGLAFLPTATAVRAVDARTGEEQWRETGDETSLWPRVVCYRYDPPFETPARVSDVFVEKLDDSAVGFDAVFEFAEPVALVLEDERFNGDALCFGLCGDLFGLTHGDAGVIGTVRDE